MEDSGGNSSDNEMKSSSSCPRGHWRPAEDEKLRKLVEQYGPQNWNSIAEKLQGRSGKSCRLRWFNQLDPRINRKPFTEEEEERLLTAHRIHGNKWALISRLFPGRTDNAVKNHWHVIMARMQRERSKQQTSKRGLISSSNVSSNTSLSLSNHDFLSKSSKSLNISSYGSGFKSDIYHQNHGLHKFEQYMNKDRSKGNTTSNTKGWSFAPSVLNLDKYRASSSSISTRAQSLQGNCNWVGGNSSSSSSFFEQSNGSFASKILSSNGSSTILLDGGGQFGGFSSYGLNYYQPHKVVVPYAPLNGQGQTTMTTTTMKRSSLLERLEQKEGDVGGAMVSSVNTKEVHFIDFLGVGISS